MAMFRLSAPPVAVPREEVLIDGGPERSFRVIGDRGPI